MRLRAALALTLMLAWLASPGLAAPMARGLQAQLQAIDGATSGQLGACAMLVETGELAGWHLDRAFPAQSVYKLPIALAALAAAEREGWPLDHPIRLVATDLVPGPYYSAARDAYRRGQRAIALEELVRQAIALSDNTASDVLLRLAGGPAGVNAHLRRLGLTGITVGTPLRSFQPARNLATPRALVSLLVMLQKGRGVSKEGRALMLSAMRGCKTGPARLPALLPEGTVVAHKTGTSGTFGGVTLATNDAGLITLPDGRHVAIAVFLKDSRSGEAARDRVLAEAARAAWDRWASPRR